MREHCKPPNHHRKQASEMANQSLSVCPHCGKPSKLIPLRSQIGDGQGPKLPTFHSTQYSPDFEPEENIVIEERSFWASDGITYSVAGLFCACVIGAYAWWYRLDMGAAIATTALLVGVGLHLVKIYLHAPPRLPPIEPKEKPSKVKVEITDKTQPGTHMLIAEFDEKISIDEMQRLAKAYQSGTPLSRSEMQRAARISQGKYRLIKAELERLNLVVTDDGNRNHLSLKGRALLKKLAQ